MNRSAFENALAEWRKVLPADSILSGVAAYGYQPNCMSLTRDIPVALRPQREEEVAQIAAIANRWRVPLYTVSTGHNWGYGSALPVQDGCALVDLSRMNRIVSMDRELGLVTVEPGVTQKILYDYLDAHELDYFVPTTGAGPSASIVGNALERGFGMTPDEDHFRAVTSVRAVLPSGEIYQSCMAEAGAELSGVWKWGIGPYLDGLFSQGNLGIVTQLQISLAKRPEHLEVYLFTLKDDAQFRQLIDRSREMLTGLRGHIGGMKFINRRQVELTIGSRDIGASLPTEFAWMGFGVVHCKKSMMRSIRKEIRKGIGPLTSQLVFVNKGRVSLMQRLAKLVPGSKGASLVEKTERMEHLLDIVNGNPRGLELKLVYRYVATPNRALDPARDGVGILWYAPVLPMKTDVVMQMVGMIKATLAEFGFEQAVSFTTIHEKCSIGVIPLIYDKAEGGERAQRCFDELWRRGNGLGCHPYRMNVAGMEAMTNPENSTFWSLVGAIKATVDQNNILSPGRYSPLVGRPVSRKVAAEEFAPVAMGEETFV